MTGSRVFLHLRREPGFGPHVRAVSSHSRVGRFCTDTVPVWSGVEDGLLLDLTGTERLYGPGLSGGETICRRAATEFPLLSAGLAATRLAAHLASLLARRSTAAGLLTVPGGSTSRFLSLFPLGILHRAYPLAVTLGQLGVRTLGDLLVLPSDLVKAVCGAQGVALVRLVQGWEETRGAGPDPSATGRELVVGASWRTPLSGRGQMGALQKAFARRALLSCGPDGGRRSPWELRARWPDGRTRYSRRTTWSGGGWSRWQDLLRGLWRGLGTDRSGFTRLELWSATPVEAGPVQASLFPSDTEDLALAEVMSRAGPPGAGGLGPASQVVLASLNIRWYGPSGMESPPTAAARLPAPGGGVDVRRSGG